jgi:hypothetical protein
LVADCGTNDLGCLQTEMMSDAIDDALDDDEAEEESDELTNQVGSYNYLYPLYLVKNCIYLAFFVRLFPWTCEGFPVNISETTYLPNFDCDFVIAYYGFHIKVT